ncbi:MAG: hypothetical protein COT89_00415 [Candidatus Colwellbacteria bacterium CG10_big_fil_rev_8_21_14_0_10_42_22]|uniref:Uncharacterized protein n=1 Tax=Candidatus Colwellbacteria bacterium CG10_big_fil_rev_8_21_14_0_10_42_22 TaxID=1974540 RepID=A0A2H0VGC5_9BACT|nr:MAG: hypothetical protein COT89_00415 [Candidatus Colwellbacteria bacterium CG10_big_fil_rev_8_21_14_0_10_42_22]
MHEKSPREIKEGTPEEEEEISREQAERELLEAVHSPRYFVYIRSKWVERGVITFEEANELVRGMVEEMLAKARKLDSRISAQVRSDWIMAGVIKA